MKKILIIFGLLTVVNFSSVAMAHPQSHGNFYGHYGMKHYHYVQKPIPPRKTKVVNHYHYSSNHYSHHNNGVVGGLLVGALLGGIIGGIVD